jgi:hypothetical protein
LKDESYEGGCKIKLKGGKEGMALNIFITQNKMGVYY